jgi:speckle-type POZ protein
MHIELCLPPALRSSGLSSWVPLAEAKMPHITLHDITSATFKVMLQFMYPDSLPGDYELGDALQPRC